MQTVLHSPIGTAHRAVAHGAAYEVQGTNGSNNVPLLCQQCRFAPGHSAPGGKSRFDCYLAGLSSSVMSRSYYVDDRVFQKLRAAGKTSWDEQADPQANFDTFVMRPFLEASLAALAGPLDALSALELGCGSGPICCFLAARGLAVRGLDVSPTALKMARQHAAQRGLDVQFDAADICHLDEPPGRYDLIIDGHCLHCLVLDEDRRSALAVIRRLLKPGGVFLIETMISHAGLIIGEKYRLDAQGVLAIRVEDLEGVDGVFWSDVDGAFQSDGAWFAPYRRLLSAEQVMRELDAAGFAIQFQNARAQPDPRKPMLMQIRAQ